MKYLSKVYLSIFQQQQKKEENSEIRKKEKEKFS